jgi:hypothetical protein
MRKDTTSPVRRRGVDEPPGEFLKAKAKPNGAGPGHPRSRSQSPRQIVTSVLTRFPRALARIPAEPPPKCNERRHSFPQGPGKNPRQAPVVPKSALPRPNGPPHPSLGQRPRIPFPMNRRAEGPPHPAAHRGSQSIGPADRKGNQPPRFSWLWRFYWHLCGFPRTMQESPSRIHPRAQDLCLRDSCWS